jgi:Uncharacterized protein conserved in bacteria
MDFDDVIRVFSDEKSAWSPNLTEKDSVQSLAGLYQLYSAAIKEVRTKLEILDSEFMLQYDHNPIHHIEHRLKSPNSISEKLSKRQLPFEPDVIWSEINDMAGVRVICSYIEDIYIISDFLLAQNGIELIRKKDFIETPKTSGYRSLHLVVSVPVFLSNGLKRAPVEIQIRTIAMDFWASLEHHLKYKTQRNIPEELRAELSECANSIAVLDQKMQGIHKKIGEYDAVALHKDSE